MVDDSFSKAEARFDKTWNEAIIQEIRKNPGKFGPKLSDQEVRARALECAVRYGADVHDSMNFWDLVHKFEVYIRDGVDKSP